MRPVTGSVPWRSLARVCPLNVGQRNVVDEGVHVNLRDRSRLARKAYPRRDAAAWRRASAGPAGGPPNGAAWSRGQRSGDGAADGICCRGWRDPSEGVRPETNAPCSPCGGPAIRVLLADAHTLMREGLQSLIENEPDLTVVGTAGDGVQAVRKAEECHPDVVLID